MFDRFRPKDRHDTCVGIDISTDGFAMAVVRRGDAGPAVERLRWYELAAGQDRATGFRQAVREMGARGMRVVATLPHTAYTLVQLEEPDLGAGVSDDDLRDAMRWRVKDLIDFPVDQAAIDVFRLPPSRRPGAHGLVYVVVAPQAEVEGLAGQLKSAGLRIDAISITEMSIRNLAQRIDRPGRPRAYLRLAAGQTLIEIADDTDIYLSRRVQQDYDAAAANDLLPAQMENLALEVQRSLDYFESQYALGTVDQVSVIAGDQALYDAFASVARAFLTVPTSWLELPSAATPGQLAPAAGRAATAVGAALADGLAGIPAGQQVDLHRVDGAAQRYERGARTMLTAGAAALGAVLLLAAAGEIYLYRLDAQRDRVADELQARRAALESYRAATPVPTPDPHLAAERDALQAGKAALAANLAAIARHDGMVDLRFSEVFAGLSRRAIEGLWFNDIGVTGGGSRLSLGGQTLEPALVPRLLQELAQETAFAGRTFRKVRFERRATDQGDVVDFELRSARAEGVDDAG